MDTANLPLANEWAMTFRRYDDTNEVRVGDVVIMRSEAGRQAWNPFATCIVEKVVDGWEVHLARPTAQCSALLDFSTRATGRGPMKRGTVTRRDERASVLLGNERFSMTLETFVAKYVQYVTGPNGDPVNNLF